MALENVSSYRDGNKPHAYWSVGLFPQYGFMQLNVRNKRTKRGMESEREREREREEGRTKVKKIRNEGRKVGM